MDKILKGLNVLDMTELISGPYAASLLGDMGASVIKLERPEGDTYRRSEKTLEPPFVAFNRNKRYLCLDLKKEGSAPIIKRLIERSDVVISNYRKGVMERMGIGYTACQKINPRVIYCTISAFGQKGAYSGLPATDTVIQSISGIMDSIGEFDGPPLLVSFQLVDLFTASFVVQGVLLGLYARQQGNPGMWIDISLINTAMALQTLTFTTYQMTGKLPVRCGNQNPFIAPAGAFRTKDEKYLNIVIRQESDWQRFCQSIGRPDLTEEERFKDNNRRIVNRTALNEILIPIFFTKSRDEWIQTLNKAEVLNAPVNSLADVLNDSALCESFSLMNFNLMGRGARTVGNPIEIDGEFPGMELPACFKGEHSIEILGELGYDKDEIQEMFSKGIAIREKFI